MFQLNIEIFKNIFAVEFNLAIKVCNFRLSFRHLAELYQRQLLVVVVVVVNEVVVVVVAVVDVLVVVVLFLLMFSLITFLSGLL